MNVKEFKQWFNGVVDGMQQGTPTLGTWNKIKEAVEGLEDNVFIQPEEPGSTPPAGENLKTTIEELWEQVRELTSSIPQNTQDHPSGFWKHLSYPSIFPNMPRYEDSFRTGDFFLYATDTPTEDKQSKH